MHNQSLAEDLCMCVHARYDACFNVNIRASKLTQPQLLISPILKVQGLIILS